MDIDLTEDLATAFASWRRRESLTHDDIRERGGPSSPTLTKIEQASGAISAATAKKLEDALGWPSGTVRKLSAGEETQLPTSIDEAVSWALNRRSDGPTTSRILVDGMAAARNAVAHNNLRTAIPGLIKMLEAALEQERTDDRDLLIYAVVTALRYLLEGEAFLGDAEAGADARLLFHLKAVDRDDEYRIRETEQSLLDPAAGSGAFIRRAVETLDDQDLVKLAQLAAREGFIQLPPDSQLPPVTLHERPTSQVADDDHVP